MIKILKLVLPYIITVVFNMVYSFISFLMVMAFLFTFIDDFSMPREKLIGLRSARVIIVAVVFVFMGVLNFMLAKFNKRFNYIPFLYWFLTLIIMRKARSRKTMRI